MSDRLNSLLSCPYFLVKDIECSHTAMKVPWSLLGMTMHNLAVTMCVAPSVHKELSTAERCECALAGFMTLDIFYLLAQDKCNHLRLPKGSCFWAPQTIEVLQRTALVAVLLCCTKEPQWKPFKYGQHRLSEISIEEFFGALRSRSANSQLSCRSFWQASALQAKRMGDKLNKLKLPPAGRLENPLTDEEFPVINSLQCFCMVLLFFLCFSSD